MSNRQRPTKPPRTGASWSELACPDCASVVHELWYGDAPNLVMSVEVEHSDTCPAWRDAEREVHLQFLPKSLSEHRGFVRSEDDLAALLDEER